MEDILNRARVALAGRRETTGSGNDTPVLSRMSTLIRAAGIGAVVALSACTVSPSQVGGYTVSGGSPVASLSPSGNGYGNSGYGGNGGVFGGGLLSGGLLGGVLGNRLGSANNGVATYRPDSYAGGYNQGYGHRGGMDPRDIPYAKAAADRAENGPVGERFIWESPASGNSGYYSPVEQGHLGDGRVCRRIEIAVALEGSRPQVARHLFCQNAYGGGWRQMAQNEIDNAVFPGLDVDEEPQAPRFG